MILPKNNSSIFNVDFTSILKDAKLIENLGYFHEENL